MKDRPIIDRLLNMYKENIVSFHVPGHKNGKIYDKFNDQDFKEIIYQLDTTEIPGTDNLHNPNEIIRQSQEKASRVFGSDEAYFLVNGSTSGIYSMIMAATEPGDKIIIGRNCHQSVYNAIILGDLTPVYIHPQIDEKRGIALGILPEDVENTLKLHPDAKAVLLTYPTYHGIALPLKKIREIVHKYDKILLIDEAHGAHLGLSHRLPDTALSCGADAVVQSTHKTLPSFTQSSILFVKGHRIDRDKLRLMLRFHQSSSPSYILMASLEMAVMIYEKQGKCLMETLLESIDHFRKEVISIDGIEMLDEKILGSKGVDSLDMTKLWLSMEKLSIRGYELEVFLRNHCQIQMELSNMNGILAITTIANERKDFEKLVSALKAASKGSKKTATVFLPSSFCPMPVQCLTPKQALYGQKEKMLLKDSIGRISGEYIIPYPPGIPLLVPGEMIEKELVEYIEIVKKQGVEILGLKDSTLGSIEVIK